MLDCNCVLVPGHFEEIYLCSHSFCYLVALVFDKIKSDCNYLFVTTILVSSIVSLLNRIKMGFSFG